jgi:CreA protein
MCGSPPTEISMKVSCLRPISFNCIAVLLLAWLAWPAAQALAADEPDLIFRRSTVFKLLSPNDKLATYGVDDPEVEGVACLFTLPEKGG